MLSMCQSQNFRSRRITEGFGKAEEGRTTLATLIVSASPRRRWLAVMMKVVAIMVPLVMVMLGMSDGSGLAATIDDAPPLSPSSPAPTDARGVRTPRKGRRRRGGYAGSTRQGEQALPALHVLPPWGTSSPSTREVRCRRYYCTLWIHLTLDTFISNFFILLMMGRRAVDVD